VFASYGVVYKDRTRRKSLTQTSWPDLVPAIHVTTVPLAAPAAVDARDFDRA